MKKYNVCPESPSTLVYTFDEENCASISVAWRELLENSLSVLKNRLTWGLSHNANQNAPKSISDIK